VAITATNKLNPVANAAASTLVTGTLTPAAGKIYLASVNAYRAAGAGNVPTLTGAGLTWTAVDNQSAGAGRLTVFMSSLATGSETPGALTFDFASQNQDAFSGNVHEYGGMATSGTVVQHPKGTGSGTTASVVMASFADATNNLCVFISGVLSAAPAMTVGSGFTQLGTAANAGLTTRIQAEYKTGEDLLADSTWTGSQTWVAVGLEIAIAVAAGSALPFLHYEKMRRSM
jgi:hypothetical protein